MQGLPSTPGMRRRLRPAQCPCTSLGPATGPATFAATLVAKRSSVASKALRTLSFVMCNSGCVERAHAVILCRVQRASAGYPPPEAHGAGWQMSLGMSMCNFQQNDLEKLQVVEHNERPEVLRSFWLGFFWTSQTSAMYQASFASSCTRSARACIACNKCARLASSKQLSIMYVTPSGTDASCPLSMRFAAFPSSTRSAGCPCSDSSGAHLETSACPTMC